PYSANTAYINTITPPREQKSPGNYEHEAKIRSYVRWNALAMVVRANRKPGDLGGHIASFASSAVLYDVGFNHFFRNKLAEGEGRDYGDLVYFQGHSAPGVYARAFLEGRISESQLENFRSETGGKGLSSYPHPWLMPDFWQFPTVSMGLGPIMAIYQARFMRYLENREIIPRTDRKVWAFMGDGEMDEPESLGAISLAPREELDNLIFVVNCNLQRLDGPVRGNGKIIQELEAVFRGAGWNVIKVIWGSYWDTLLYQDKKGLLKKRMEEVLDGDYQTYRANSGGYIREHFFGKYPELLEMTANMTDEDIWRLNRGGHDPHKVYAAFCNAFNHTGQPTVILAKTIKGYGMGDAGEARNIAHQQKKISDKALRRVRDRFRLPIDDSQIGAAPFFRPPEDAPEMQYLKERMRAMGGGIPSRKRVSPKSLPAPKLAAFSALLEDTGERQISTTMAFVRILSALVRDKKIGDHVVPIVPDESRTFGMEGMFRQLGIYSRHGQLYRPEDADQMMFYREDQKGQILQEGINEAGAMSSWIAAATAYSSYGAPMLPFFIFYSMFGFQRIGDLAWAAGDMRARGFLLGATSGRTTLNGEGLQHEDGHSQVQAQLIPNCRSYDPSFACELAVIVQSGIYAMLEKQEDIFYYITLMNENYRHIALPKGAEENILRGLHGIRKSEMKKPKARARLVGGGAILQEVIAAAELLENDFGVAADIYSATSFNMLARDGHDCARWNGLHPDAKPKISHAEKMLSGDDSPVVAATDYIRLYADQIRAFVPAHYTVLGTDGFGRSDTRWNLRRHFEVDKYAVAVAALAALAQQGKVPAQAVKD
ncbi:MAG: pyruvate dehydrogenase (acetyl-transferring), homodimeric type, partial [Betaproteobacteria bacterium]|nr:pyruvate dehydrogenase (acetyl-transferring), homodimeric type [Betaproteobacteria bacterium]